MKWMLISLICLATPPIGARALTPMGNTTHIATAQGNPAVVAAIIQRHIWVTLNGGRTWVITGTLSGRRHTPTAPVPVDRDAALPFLSSETENTQTAGASTVEEADEIDNTVTASRSLLGAALHLAVSNNGDVVFWQPETNRITRCPMVSACGTLATHADVRGIAIDGDNIIWVAVDNHVVAYRMSRVAAQYPVLQPTGLTLSATGSVMATTKDGVFAFSSGDTEKFSRILSVPSTDTVAVHNNRLLISHRGQISEIDGQGELLPLTRLNGQAQKMVATHNAVWVKVNQRWMRFRSSQGHSETSRLATGRPMPGVGDAAKDAKGNIWLATTTGPMMALDDTGGRAPMMPNRCGFVPPAINRVALKSASLPRTDTVWRSLLPRVRLWVAITDTTSAKFSKWHPLAASHRDTVQLGVFFVWQRRDSLAHTARMHEQIFQREYRRRRHHTHAMTEINRHWLKRCSAAHSSTDPLQSAIFQLQTRKWQAMRQYTQAF